MDEMINALLEDLIKKMFQSSGLVQFVNERAKFEGWLKVEVCDSLCKQYPDVHPEENLIDISFKDWSIELKTLNTNYRFQKVRPKHKPIDTNVKSVKEDIKKLKMEITSKNKGILFVVFPCNINNIKWIIHKNKIENELSQPLIEKEFTFKNGVPGLIYFGFI